MGSSTPKLDPDTQGKGGSVNQKAEHQGASSSRQERMTCEFIVWGAKPQMSKEKNDAHQHPYAQRLSREWGTWREIGSRRG